MDTSHHDRDIKVCVNYLIIHSYTMSEQALSGIDREVK